MSRHGARTTQRPKHCIQSGKTRHQTRKSALTSANRTMKLVDAELRIYRCSYCHGWHLTKQAPGRKRAVEAYQQQQQEGVTTCQS